MTTETNRFNRWFHGAEIDHQRSVGLMALPTVSAGKMFFAVSFMAGRAVGNLVGSTSLLRVLQVAIAAFQRRAMGTTPLLQRFKYFFMTARTATVNQLTHVTGKNIAAAPEKHQQNQQRPNQQRSS